MNKLIEWYNDLSIEKNFDLNEINKLSNSIQLVEPEAQNHYISTKPIIINGKSYLVDNIGTIWFHDNSNLNIIGQLNNNNITFLE